MSIKSSDIDDFIRTMVPYRNSKYPEIKVCCPLCDQPSNSFKLYINVEDRVWHCKKCHYGEHKNRTSDFFWVLSEISGLDLDSILEMFGENVPSDTNVFTSRLKELLEDNSTIEEDFFVIPDGMFEDPKFLKKKIKDGGYADNYLRGRGLSRVCYEKYNIRESDHFLGFFGHFAVFTFPSFIEGRSASQARRVDGREPKYLSTKSLELSLFPDIVLITELVEKKKFLVVVEGIFDAIGLIELGIPAICTFGNKMSLYHLEWLKANMKGIELVIGYDSDLNTRNAVAALAKNLSLRWDVSIIDTSKHPFPQSKVDFGDCLLDKSYKDWAIEKVDNRFKVNSSSYFTWLQESVFHKDFRKDHYSLVAL